MFDRIGRIDSETPFVVEWFVKQGIQVWSTQEGQQKFEDQTDKLMNYIRFWQANRESQKTSMRLKTRMAQLTEAGIYHGGTVPCGFMASLMGGRLLNYVHANNNQVFGISMYGQQLLSAISFVLVVITILFMHFVVAKQEVKVQ